MAEKLKVNVDKLILNFGGVVMQKNKDFQFYKIKPKSIIYIQQKA